MRAYLLVTALICAANPSSMAARSVPPDELAISLSRDVDDGRPILVVTITNLSARHMCLGAEVLRNPETWALDVELRDSRRRAIRRRSETGFLLPPLSGVVSIDPANSERAHYYLDFRFRLPSIRAWPRQRLSARVSFAYDHCGDSAPRRATSPWQPI